MSACFPEPLRLFDRLGSDLLAAGAAERDDQDRQDAEHRKPPWPKSLGRRVHGRAGSVGDEPVPAGEPCAGCDIVCGRIGRSAIASRFQHARRPIDWPAHTAVSDPDRPAVVVHRSAAGVLQAEDQVGGLSPDGGSLGSATRSNWLALSKAQVATEARRRTRQAGLARRRVPGRRSARSTARRPGALVSAATIDGEPLVAAGRREVRKRCLRVGPADRPAARGQASHPGPRGTSRAATAPAKANGSAPAHRYAHRPTNRA